MSPRVEGGGEALVGPAHRVEVAGSEVGHGLGDGEAVHRRDDGVCLAHLVEVDLRDHGGPARRGPDEARPAEAEQGLADRRTTHAEPGRQLGVAHDLARRQRAVDDRVPQPVVDRVPQQRGAE